MATRFSAFATIKMLSISSLIINAATNMGTEQGVISTYFKEAFFKMSKELKSSGSNVLRSKYDNIYMNDPEDSNKIFKGSLFRNVGLATNISINESYGTRSLYNLGEQTNPAMVPGNVAVTVSITRLTTDSKSIADYVTKPSYYYNTVLQNTLFQELYKQSGIYLGFDMPFYTFIAISDLEQQGTLPYNSYDAINNYPLVAFMPRSYSRRLDSGTAEVLTDVEGEGKIVYLKSLVQALVT